MGKAVPSATLLAKPCVKCGEVNRSETTGACKSCQKVNHARWKASLSPAEIENIKLSKQVANMSPEAVDKKRKRSREWDRSRRANRTPEEIEQDREYDRQLYVARTPEQIERDLRTNREWVAKQGPDFYRRRRESLLLWNYGISLEAYEELLAHQGGTCAVCPATSNENGKRLSIDHCHKTGEIRGILCNPCNLAVGSMKDEPLRLERAAAYLRTKKAKAA